MSESNPVPDRRPITKRTRLPRFERVKNPPRMVLTERDTEILRQVHRYRLMTREQVERLLFPPDHHQDHPTKTSKARKRLQLLYHHGYLERIPVPVGPGAWAWRPVYHLSRKGARLIAPVASGDTSEPGSLTVKQARGSRAPEISLLFLDHLLKINDVRIAVMQAAARRGFRVDKWLEETRLKSQEMKDYVSVASEQGRSTKVAVIPDAYFVLHLGDRRAHFFLELDRATMSNQRWKTRVLAYLAYIRSGKYQARYQTRSLRILTVTTTRQRMENLRRTTARAQGGDVFWFTTIDQVAAEKVFSSPIWLLAGEEQGRAARPLLS